MRGEEAGFGEPSITSVHESSPEEFLPGDSFLMIKRGLGSGISCREHSSIERLTACMRRRTISCGVRSFQKSHMTSCSRALSCSPSRARRPSLSRKAHARASQWSLESSYKRLRSSQCLASAKYGSFLCPIVSSPYCSTSNIL